MKTQQKIKQEDNQHHKMLILYYKCIFITIKQKLNVTPKVEQTYGIEFVYFIWYSTLRETYHTVFLPNNETLLELYDNQNTT